MSGEPGDQPPTLLANQANIVKDPKGGLYVIGSYQLNNWGGHKILYDVAPPTAYLSNTQYYGLGTNDSNWCATHEFQTSGNTAMLTFSVNVGNPQSAARYDIAVQKRYLSEKRIGKIRFNPIKTGSHYGPCAGSDSNTSAISNYTVHPTGTIRDGGWACCDNRSCPRVEAKHTVDFSQNQQRRSNRHIPEYPYADYEYYFSYGKVQSYLEQGDWPHTDRSDCIAGKTERIPQGDVTHPQGHRTIRNECARGE
ncbi:MAG: hypothetical protein WCF90_07195 [Methanomicrobiales archaeon]